MLTKIMMDINDVIVFAIKNSYRLIFNSLLTKVKKVDNMIVMPHALNHSNKYYYHALENHWEEDMTYDDVDLAADPMTILLMSGYATLTGIKFAAEITESSELNTIRLEIADKYYSNDIIDYMESIYPGCREDKMYIDHLYPNATKKRKFFH